jgi:hypothetical protein
MAESLRLCHVFRIFAFSLRLCQCKMLSLALMTSPLTLTRCDKIERFSFPIAVWLSLSESIEHCISWLLHTLVAKFCAAHGRRLMLWS